LFGIKTKSLEVYIVEPSSVARRGRKKKRRKSALSAHLCGLFAAISVSNDF